jgi:D-alanyl-D-alanine carboxypeptidase
MSIEDLLYGTLLSSANDASLVLAEGIGGSVERFAEIMTFKAREIGATNSRFSNPHGLTHPGHYSTARDLAMLFNYAMKNPTFREIIQTKTISVHSVSTDKATRVRTIPIRNRNRLLWSFEGAIGGKTGYTRAAKRTFVGGASRDGVTLIVSVLGSRNLWGDTKKLLEFGFQHHETLTTSSSNGSESPSSASQRITSQNNPPSPLSPWAKDQKIFSVDGYTLQVASFRERDKARSLQLQIIDEGFQAYLESIALNNGEVTFRVKVGHYSHLSRAQEAAQDIERRSGLKPIVIPAAAVDETEHDPS